MESEHLKKELFALPRISRGPKIKELKKKKRLEINSQRKILPKEFQKGIHVGLRATLRALEKNSINALIYDSTTNFEALKILFDKGQVPMVPLPNLSKVVREITDFPALCISFPKESPSDQVKEHFKEIVDAIESHPGYNRVIKKETKTEKVQEDRKSVV